MSQSCENPAAVNLPELVVSLLEKAGESKAQRAAQPVYGGSAVRQTVIAIKGGAELGEHDSPPEAIMHVLQGTLRLNGVGRGWEVSAGELIAIPAERHSVSAITDCAFLLTVRHALPEHPAVNTKEA